MTPINCASKNNKNVAVETATIELIKKELAKANKKTMRTTSTKNR
jgi:hypothetical protein